MQSTTYQAKRINNHILIIAALLLFQYSCTPEKKPSKSQPPNILLIVADDLGYADLGCYGGDIETPNIDQLSREGIRFSRFHTAPLCAPTRAMLLSGNDNHIAGMGCQGLVTDEFGYEGRLSDRVAIIPEILQKKGYHTYMAGKWHLGSFTDANPHKKGFTHSFVNLGSSGNHYTDQGLFASTPVSLYTEDGQTVGWPQDAYSTNLFTDKLIGFIERNLDDGKPFFAFAAYTSPHWPLQVDEKYWKKYEGRYDDGYEALKERRLASLIQAGMVPENAVLPPNHPRVIPWDSLSVEDKKKEARKMELYAGMVDNLDENIGRLIQFLKEMGQYENTLIIFMSDNGSAAEDFYYSNSYGPFLRENYTDSYEDMGKSNSFISYGPQWAEAGSAPFKYFKGQSTEGAMIAPMIISGPGLDRAGDIEHAFVTLMDIAPTIYTWTNAKYPARFKGHKIYPLKGKSLVPLVEDREAPIHDGAYVFAIEHAERVSVRRGNWKLLNTLYPFNEANFELYNLENDLAEINDLRKQEPEIYQELRLEWERYAQEIQVQFPLPSPTKQTTEK